MTSQDILYDHYKNTVNEIKQQEIKRNKLFILIILHIFILLLISLKPDGICNAISDFLIGQWQMGFYFSINIIQIAIMISLLYCVVRYFQINVQIEKTYPYIHKLEKELSKQVNVIIEKEGKNYLSNYPKTQDIVYFSYKYLFPILFIIALIYRFIINDTWKTPIVKILELVISGVLIVLNIVYTIDTYKQSKEK